VGHTLPNELAAQVWQSGSRPRISGERGESGEDGKRRNTQSKKHDGPLIPGFLLYHLRRAEGRNELGNRCHQGSIPVSRFTRSAAQAENGFVAGGFVSWR